MISFAYSCQKQCINAIWALYLSTILPTTFTPAKKIWTVWHARMATFSINKVYLIFIFYNSRFFMFAFMFGGCCAKLKNIWTAFFWEGWDKSVWLVARLFGNSCNPSSLSKRRNSFFYRYLDFIIRQLLINFIIFFGKVMELIWNQVRQTFQTNQ